MGPPIQRALHAVLELIEIRAEPLTRLFDILLYVVRCFAHCTSSLMVCTVRSGTGSILLNLALPPAYIAPPMQASSTPMMGAASHTGITIASPAIAAATNAPNPMTPQS